VNPAVHGAERLLLRPWAPHTTQTTPTLPLPHHSLFYPVTPSSVQPVSPPMVMSTSLAADLEGLTLTDSSLVPSVSGREMTWLGQGHSSMLCPVVWVRLCGEV
jgi:hypothetical protein